MSVLAERRRRKQLEELCRLRPLGEAFVLRRFAGGLNRADAEDVVYEVIARFARRYVDEQPENLRAAFFTSVRNQAVDLIRSSQVRVQTCSLEEVADQPSFEEVDEDATFSELLCRLEGALEQVAPKQRVAMELRIAGHTIPEIANELGCSLPSAKKRVHRATRKLRACFAEEL